MAKMIGGSLKRFVCAAALLLVWNTAATAQPVLDGRVDPAEGWVLAAEDCKDVGASAPFARFPVSLYTYCDETHAYLAWVGTSVNGGGESAGPAQGFLFHDPSIDPGISLDPACDGNLTDPGALIQQAISTFGSDAYTLCGASILLNWNTGLSPALCTDHAKCVTNECDKTAQGIHEGEIHFEMSWPRGEYRLESGLLLEYAKWNYEVSTTDNVIAGFEGRNRGTRRCDLRGPGGSASFCDDATGLSWDTNTFLPPTDGWELLLADLLEPVCEPPIPTLAGELDIRPNDCPNSVPGDGDKLPVALLGFDGFDVWRVNPDTLRLEGTAPMRIRYRDQAAPHVVMPGEPEPDECECFAHSRDGHMDIRMEFSIIDLFLNSEKLRNAGHEELVPMVLTGEYLTDEGPVPFEATDCGLIIHADTDGDGRGNTGKGGKGKGGNHK